MAYQIIQKNGVPTAVIDGREYPLLNNFDTGEVMPSGANGGYVKTGPNSGYYINGIFAGGPINDMAISRQDDMQAFIEAGKRNAEDGWLNKIMPAIALAGFGGIGASAYGAGLGMSGAAGSGAAVPAVGGASTLASSAPVYYDAALGGFVDTTTGAAVSATEASSMINSAVAAGTMTPSEALAAMTTYGNSMAPGAAAGLTGGASAPGWLDMARQGVTSLFNGGGSPAGTAASGMASILGNGSGGINWGGLGAAALGALAGGSNGAKEAGTTTTTQAPWSPMQPYLLAAGQSAADIYKNSQTMPQGMQDVLAQAQGTIGNQLNNGMYGQVQGVAGGLLGGAMQGVNIPQTFSGLGALDPTGAYASQLSGQVNPYVDQMAQSITNQVNRNTLENVMPSIRSGAQAAGQYGSSRQGIAEGLAASRAQQDLGSSLSSLYGSAYENAQGRQAAAANQLGTMGVNNAQNNNSQRLAQFNTGANLWNQANNTQNTAIQNALGIAGYPNQYKWDQLKNYGSVVNPMAGMGGSTSQPYYNNPTASAIGGALTGAQMYKSIFG